MEEKNGRLDYKLWCSRWPEMVLKAAGWNSKATGAIVKHNDNTVAEEKMAHGKTYNAMPNQRRCLFSRLRQIQLETWGNRKEMKRKYHLKMKQETTDTKLLGLPNHNGGKIGGSKFIFLHILIVFFCKYPLILMDKETTVYVTKMHMIHVVNQYFSLGPENHTFILSAMCVISGWCPLLYYICDSILWIVTWHW